MKSPAHPSRRRRSGAFAALLALSLAAMGAPAADLRLEAQLIWGANDAPASVNHKLADPALAAALRRNNFKWTNYYQITNLTAVIPLNQSRDLRMSGSCALAVKNLGGSLVAVDWIGQGRQVSKGTNTLPCIYAGTNANDTAWFVHLRSLDDKK